ncbi:MAG: helix-turn-helix domain-containing protein [Halobacteriales archaeon]|nr:helix-turn-helix domain-containing protein [Halobacteriales archaeon]
MREALVSINESEFAALGIEELVSLFQTAGIREFEALACHGDSAIIQVEVETEVDERRLQSLDYVDEWERLSETTDTHLYVIAFSIPDVSEDLAEHVTELVGTCEPEVSENGATMSLVGSQETIAGALTEYEKEGISPTLRKLGEYHGRTRPLDELTDRQREVIQTAYDMGYYEVPREVSTEAIAAELDVDPSTVAEHLQRAERNLLSYHLAPE